MKFYGRAEQTAQRILEAFQSGNVPRPLARCFLRRDIPMSSWSWNNQFGCFVSGCTDARGMKQWNEVGRKVRKSQHSLAAILVPLQAREDKDNPDSPLFIYGYRGIPVFDVSQTEGAALDYEEDEQQFIEGLPLVHVARELGLKVKVADTWVVSALGAYSSKRQLVMMGVSNIDVWLHELVHAADDKLGSLTEKGQHWCSEIVAELGSTTLAVMLGEDEKADLGGAWNYIQRYSQEAEIEPITACMRVLDRAACAINLIMEMAEKVGQPTAVGEVM